MKKEIHAGKLMSIVAKVAKGSGGGKAHMAFGGGKDPSKINTAFDKMRSLLRELTNKK